MNIKTLLEAANHLEAGARGREAFWLGRPIWSNPLMGHDARAWTAGWKAALAELSTRHGVELSASDAETPEWETLLAQYRPDDISTAPRPKTPPPPRSSSFNPSSRQPRQERAG